MRRKLLLGLYAIGVLLLPMPVGAQSTQTEIQPRERRVVRKIRIRHADPQLIYLLLSGKLTFGQGPEISTGQIDLGNKPKGG